MENITRFLIEAQKDDIIKALESTKFDFSDCPASKTLGSQAEMYKTAKAQEKVVIDALKSVLPDYEVLGCEDWCTMNKLNYAPKYDLWYGDLMIVKDGKTFYNIDLKVGTGEYIGTPEARSLAGFGSSTVRAAGEFIYLCCNEVGGTNYCVSQKKLYSAYRDGKYGFVISHNRKKKFNDNCFDKCRLMAPKNGNFIGDNVTLYDEDFVPTSVIKKFA